MVAEQNSLNRWDESGPMVESDAPRRNGADGLPNYAQDDSVMFTRVASLLDDVTENSSSMSDAGIENSELSDPELSSHESGSNESGNPQLGDDTQFDAYNDAALLEHDFLLDQADLRIRGRADGVAIEIGRGEWPDILTQLDARLEQSATFFRGGNVALMVGRRHVDEVALQELRELLERFSLTLGVVRTGSERTFDAALAIGLAATLEGDSDEEQIVAHPAESNDTVRAHFVYRGNLRSGQLLHRRESILVIGDVNPGANVVSDGDVLVWGRLRGVAQAGAAGNEAAIIAALLFEPIQLRIGELIAIAPDRPAENKRAGQSSAGAARVAYVTDERIVVADWQEAKRDGRRVLGRS